jgi:inorganic pyrophosphatase
MAFPDFFYRWRPHPWHGLDAGSNPPQVVNAYIEITPFDHVKYEIDKKTGYLVVDRPNRTSSHPPSLYGFVPRTYCGKRVAALMGKYGVKGDHDPLDICVLSERPIARADIILELQYPCIMFLWPTDTTLCSIHPLVFSFGGFRFSCIG